MNKYVVLAAVITGGLIIGKAANELTNRLQIGGETVDSKVVDGKIVGEKWIVVSNTLIKVHTEVTPIPGPSGASEPQSDSEPSLRLLLSTGDGPAQIGRVKGLRGLIYMAADFRTPELAETNRVDICASEDNSRIVVMVRDNGPIYSSTNSGMTWLTINTPGKYEFPLTGDRGGGFKAAATIYPSSENPRISRSPSTNWYAIGSAPDASGLILTGNSSQGVPALSIMLSSAGAVVSWSSAFTGFVLQANEDLSSTNWVDMPNPVKRVGQENRVFVPSPAPNTFYRLRHGKVSTNN